MSVCETYLEVMMVETFDVVCALLPLEHARIIADDARRIFLGPHLGDSGLVWIGLT